MICPKCGKILKENLQYSDPCFVKLTCEDSLCGCSFTFDCNITNNKHDITQILINNAYNLYYNKKGRWKDELRS